MQTNTQDTAEFRSDHGFAAEFFVPPASPLKVEFGAKSDIGLVRENNEDHFAVFRRVRTQEALLTSLGEEQPPEVSSAIGTWRAGTITALQAFILCGL